MSGQTLDHKSPNPNHVLIFTNPDIPVTCPEAADAAVRSVRD